MKKSIIFLGLSIALICLVGTVAGATETLTVVYDTSGQHTFSMSSGGNTYITVKDSSNTYHYYAPATDDLVSSSLSGGTWETVKSLGDGTTLSAPSSSSNGYIIGGTSNGYINTGVIPTSNTNVELITNVITVGTSTSPRYIFGSNPSTGGFYIGIYQNKWRVAVAGGNDVTPSVSLSTKYTLSLNSSKFTYNTASSSITPGGSNYGSDALYIFDASRSGAGYRSIGKAYFYAVKIYSGEAVVRNLIPVKYGSIYAFYDISFKDNGNNKVIYNNDGSNSLSGSGTETALTYSHIVQGGPTINSVQITSSSIGSIGDEITGTVSASSGTGQISSYQWYYKTANSWVIISGQTTSSLSFTPENAGEYYFKVIVSDSAGSTDSSSGFPNVKINVLNSYDPQSVSAVTSTIQAGASDNYQAQKEFIFGSSITFNDISWISNTEAIIAAGNAVYKVSAESSGISPVSEWTGNTISRAYIGNTKAIINDIDNNVAIYDYDTGNANYISADGSNAVAITDTYAAVVENGTLKVYNNNLQMVASIACNATTLYANDNTNIFAYYTGAYLKYYVISGSTITEHSHRFSYSSLPSYTVINVISLEQVRGTNNWIVDLRFVGFDASKTVIVSIDANGNFNEVAHTGDTDAGIEGVISSSKSSSSNTIILAKTSSSSVFIYSNSGSQEGTYTSGGVVNDVSISVQNGLFAIFGGVDHQAYFLNKRESSTWVLGQATDFEETIYKSQLSNDGTFAIIGTSSKYFLFKWEETVESTFFLNGVVIDGDGLPYANKYISINSNSVLTDDSGFFVYPVSPGKTYSISAGSKTIRYTATNQALQTLSIKLTSKLISQDVVYMASYNSTSGNIEMIYTDSASETNSVTWSVRDTTTGHEVSRQTVLPGTTAYYNVPQNKTNDNYFVSVSADRGTTAVKNTWSITPSGQGQIINLFGMDDTGKNILFGFFIILLAGLFGYMHQHIGTIIVAFAAAILRYLGLITVPWIMILIAVVVAIVAAIAHRGDGK